MAHTDGVRWRITILVVSALLIVGASLTSLRCAGRAIAAAYAGRSLIDVWLLTTTASRLLPLDPLPSSSPPSGVTSHVLGGEGAGKTA